ncbi:hypothetical protein B0W81_02330 [Prochlorococcus sp. HOT_208_60]|nr:hypothetical protein B0W81_02330 [Prochlorococcus sp. HOT_208_60]
MDLSIANTRIKGVKIINYDSFEDFRGLIWTTYLKEKIDIEENLKFNHDKFSISYKDVIRGIHYDKKTFKLVTSVYGAIDQVVVDMRQDSNTYKETLMFKIDDAKRFSILIPPMVGNGFRVKSDVAVYHYKLSYEGDYLDANDQYTIKWDDSTINIKWNCDNPKLSKRDS